MNKQVHLADLTSCHRRIRDELDAAWNRVMDRSMFVYGEEVNGFEEELAAYVGIRHVVGCGNGTDALIGAIKALRLPDGAEIIAPNFTFIAPVEAILQAGYRAALVDIDQRTFTMDPQKLEEAIAPDTRAVIAVHLNGQCADMETIRDVTRRHNLYLIEDSAQGIGAQCKFADGSRRKAGSMGDISTTSFFPTKNLGGIGDGGAVLTDDDEMMQRMRTYFAHGKAGVNHQSVGVNSRLDGIQAAVLRVKLRHLEDFTRRRQQLAERYDEGLVALRGIETPFVSTYSTHTYHKYSILVTAGARKRLQKMLSEHNIESKVYYEFPCHMEPPYADSRFVNLDVSRKIATQILSIPMHSELTNEQQLRTIDVLASFDQTLRE